MYGAPIRWIADEDRERERDREFIASLKTMPIATLRILVHDAEERDDRTWQAAAMDVALKRRERDEKR